MPRGSRLWQKLPTGAGGSAGTMAWFRPNLPDRVLNSICSKTTPGIAIPCAATISLLYLLIPQTRISFWIGTKGGGLNRLDTRSMQFTHLTTREGLPNDVIYGILSDDRNRLWMSSNKGLICYTPSTGAIKNYTKEDGLQDNEFNTWAYGKGPDGALLFGGVNGLTVFQPSQLLEDTLAPLTKITGLHLNDRDISWKDSTGILDLGIEYTSEITVPFSRNNLTLEFVALNFTSPDKNRFRYYLEGAENEWEHESSDHTASYLNLAPGNMFFA